MNRQMATNNEMKKNVKDIKRLIPSIEQLETRGDISKRDRSAAERLLKAAHCNLIDAWNHMSKGIPMCQG